MTRAIFVALIALVGFAATDLRTQDTADIVISRVGTRPLRVGPVENFTGTVHAETLFDTTAMTRAYGASVSFAAGARTAWHSHPRGQTLIVTSGAAQGTPQEQEILSLSRTKWRWMSERKVDSLAALFHDEAVFVHMGGTMSKTQELDVIRGGMIQYKTAEIQEASVRFIGSTAILLNRIRLTAVVGGNEVINPFVVTEVYVQQNGAWKLVSLSFTRLLTPP